MFQVCLECRLSVGAEILVTTNSDSFVSRLRLQFRGKTYRYNILLRKKRFLRVKTENLLNNGRSAVYNKLVDTKVLEVNLEY